MRWTRFALAVLCVIGTAGVADLSPASAAPAPSAGPAPPAAAVPTADAPPPGGFRAVAPVRVLDTRLTGGRLGPREQLTVRVLDAHGVPATGVGAVQLHVTSDGASGSSHLTVHPSGGPTPPTSSLNYVAETPVANTVTVRPGPDGLVVISNGHRSVDVVVDLVGWWAAPGPGDDGLHGIVPTRLWDSRVVGNRVTRTPTRLGVVGGQVPVGAVAVVANLTTVNASASGLPLLSWASGSPRPDTSNGNTVRGSAVATQVLVGVGPDGKVAVAVGSQSTDLVVDVVGYVLGGPAPGGRLAGLSPTRLLDTRAARTPMAHGERIVVPVAGRGGSPGDAAAAVLTVTAVPGEQAAGTFTVFANGEPKPATSDVNARADVPVAQQVIVSVGVDGAVAVARAWGRGHVVVDLVGYVTATPLPAVVAPSAALLSAGLPSTALARDAQQVLEGAVRHGLGVWWWETAPGLLERPMDARTRWDRQDPVRRLGMQALAVSTALATGTYAPDDTGMTVSEARQVVATIVGEVACRHRSSVVGGWGDDWQSPMWASLLGRAAWLSWSSVPGPARRCVTAMVQREADFASGLQPLFQYAPDGTELRRGNSGSEENSWFALAPATGLAMMPTAEHRDRWRSAQVRLLAASWTRADQLAADPVVDGQPLSSLAAGVNVLPDGSVVNHARLAPDYSTNAYQNIDAVLLAALARQSAPEAALLGLDAVYGALGTNEYAVTDGFDEPGGAVYRAHDPEVVIYYPQGCDWGLGQVLPYALFDVQAHVFGFGGPRGSAADAAAAAAEHLAEAAALQRRAGDGRMYVDPAEYTYVGREEHTAQLASQLVLTLVLATGGVDGARVAPQDVDAPTPGELEPPPAPVDESRVMEPSATG